MRRAHCEGSALEKKELGGGSYRKKAKYKMQFQLFLPMQYLFFSAIGINGIVRDSSAAASFYT